MALTNAFILHRIHCQKSRTRSMSHADFLMTLHAQLLAVTPEDMMEGSAVRCTRSCDPLVI
jgi:hypothetical protein